MIGRGALVLVPNTLDFGMQEPLPDLQDVLPLGVIRRAAGLQHWIAENAKPTRAFLTRVGAVVPRSVPQQAIAISELPRSQKGLHNAALPSLDALLTPALHGSDIGLISEAGLPAVAEPGATLVQAAHGHGLDVVTLPGPSALLLALAASGLNGQSFAFVGYLPIDADARGARLRELEALSRRSAQTQLMIETPYRNAALLAAMLGQLQGSTRLSVSCGLTMPSAFTRSDTVARWKDRPSQVPADVPAVFSLLAA